MPDSPENKGFGQSDPHLLRWAEELFQPEDPVLREIRERSVKAGLPAIAVGRFDGLHLEVLARALSVRKAVEVGTLGGYSGTCLLRGMGPEGVLHTFEISAPHAEVARESFRKAGVLEQVRLHLGPAAEKLDEINGEGPFDLVFIDADKVGYPIYLKWAAQHLRVGGTVLGDNAFGWGRVATRDSAEESIRALRTFNEELARGGRFRSTMLPTAEGLAMGVKIR